MNTYSMLTADHRSALTKKVLLPLLIAVVSITLCTAFDGQGAGSIFALIGVATAVYLFNTAMQFGSLSMYRSSSHKVLKREGVYEDAMAALPQSRMMSVDGRTFAINAKYLYLPHGAIYRISDLLWIYPKSQRFSYMFIPLVNRKWLNMELTNGTACPAFYGKIGNESEVTALLTLLQRINPNILLGYTNENAEMYRAYIRSYRAR
jgi:hypothetical protein